MQTAEPHPVCRCLHVATEPHYDVIINPVLMQLLFTSCIREISTISVTVFVYIFVYMYNICIYGGFFRGVRFQTVFSKVLSNI